MGMALPLFVGLALVGGRQAAPERGATGWWWGLGFSGYHRQLPGLEGLQRISASLERLIPPQPDPGAAAVGAAEAPRRAEASGGAGGQLHRRAAGLRPRGGVVPAARETRSGALLVLAVPELAPSPGHSGEEVAPGRCASPGWPAARPACCDPAVPAVCGHCSWRCSRRRCWWLSLLNANGLHLGAGADGDDGGAPAAARWRQAGMIGPVSTIAMGVLVLASR